MFYDSYMRVCSPGFKCACLFFFPSFVWHALGLFNCVVVAELVSVCLLWVLRDAVIAVLTIFVRHTWDLTPQTTPSNLYWLYKTWNLWRWMSGAVHSSDLQSARSQSRWVIKPFCDISKWASYFVIDWQWVTVLTQSLTFCRTCTPKSCFWPFSHFTHSDRQRLMLSIFSLIWIVLDPSQQIKPQHPPSSHSISPALWIC